jgi:hypothetical protein
MRSLNLIIAATMLLATVLSMNENPSGMPANKMLAKMTNLEKTKNNIAQLRMLFHKAAGCWKRKIGALLDIYKEIKAIRKTWSEGAVPKLNFEETTAAYKKVYDLQAKEKKLQDAEEKRVAEKRPCV